ncbi:head GIN domain-containing protein [uncultured Algibacter sp.]|uniref:head GIN domain-containing protein n=1 Tax=uncultured Algibacter sp. TaxID=298659 RepID=UPI0026228BFE|nr:head GIN domain-containing protein [uncultured Algibacter sp.]
MKTKTIKTKHVYSGKKESTVYLKNHKEGWSPINFHWIPTVKLNNELNIITNKMKNLVILPIALLLTFLSSCSRDTITGSGSLTSEFRNVANFTKVDSEGVFNVIITQGASQSIEVIADDNIINEVKTNVEDDELKLYLDDDYNYRGISLKVNIIVPSINSIKNSGIGNITIIDVDTIGDFYVYNSGTGDISIEGGAKSLTLKNEGSGNFEGLLFTINDCNVNIIGSGDCKVNCTNNLNVRIEGSGDVYYIGAPVIEANISGSGKIINSN